MSLLRFVYQSDQTHFSLDFAAGEPNNYKGVEDCVHFSPKSGTRPYLHPFNDVACFLKDFAIPVCQAAPVPYDIGPLCQAGYKQVQYQCYKVHKTTMTHQQAQQTCASEGATLIEPRSQADFDLLQTEFGNIRER